LYIYIKITPNWQEKQSFRGLSLIPGGAPANRQPAVRPNGRTDEPVFNR
jgi:hypothetical protein